MQTDEIWGAEEREIRWIQLIKWHWQRHKLATVWLETKYTGIKVSGLKWDVWLSDPEMDWSTALDIIVFSKPVTML